MTYSLKCTCGDVFPVDANSHDEAVSKFKEMMTPEVVAQHYSEKHPGEPVLTQEQVSANIDQGVEEGDQSAGAPPAGAPPAGDAQPA